MVFSPRYLFFAVRAVDQTGRAFRNLSTKFKNLEEAQTNIANASYRLMFAGVALTTFASLAAKAIAGTLDTTVRGSRALGDYEIAMNRIKKAFAEGVMDNFGDSIEQLINEVDELSKNDKFWDLISGVIVPLTISLGVTGIAITAAAIAAKIIGGIVAALVALGLMSPAAGTAALAWVAGTAIPILLPVLITLGVLSIAWHYDWGGIRTSITNMREKVLEEVGKIESARTSVSQWGSGQIGRGDMSLEAMQWLSTGITDIPMRELNQTVYIESYISQIDDETAYEVFMNATSDAVTDKVGITPP